MLQKKQSSNLDYFDLLNNMVPKVANLYSKVKTNPHDKTEEQVNSVVNDICQLAIDDKNATLAAIHLCVDRSPLTQPVHSCLIAYLLSIEHNITGKKRDALLKATLFANLCFYEFQALLNMHTGKLTDAQRSKLHKHPLEAARLLESKGFTCGHLLNAIRQHHERLDGKGYPNGIGGKDISELALIVSMCEVYTARIKNRAHRNSVHPRMALSHLYKEEDERVGALLLSLAKAIGLYPPGTWVRLANGEISIVNKVSRTSPIPGVLSLFDKTGAPYMGPIERDAKQAEFKIIGVVEPERNPSVDLRLLFTPK